MFGRGKNNIKLYRVVQVGTMRTPQYESRYADDEVKTETETKQKQVSGVRTMR